MYVRNILLSVGIGALLLGVALAVLWARQGNSGGPAPAAVARTSVLVAAGDIRPGTLLRAEDMAWKQVPASAVPPAAIVQASGAERRLLGAVTRRKFAAGEALVPGGLVLPGGRGFLAAVLSPGMRAVSVAVDAASSNAGLILPGDYVDVILAQSLAGPADGRSAVSETVLQNVRVIAVDQNFSVASRGAASGPLGLGAAETRIPKTMTLEVDEDDAKRLLVAAQLGKVTLAMRALQGAYAVPERPRGDTRPVWAGDISQAMRGGRAPAQGSRTGAPVQIMRGSKTEAQ